MTDESKKANVTDYVRIAVKLKEDGFASAEGAKFAVRLAVVVPGRSQPHKAQSVVFAYEGDHDALNRLLDGLKKDKTVELVAKLDGSGKLVAQFMRIERVDFALTDAEGATPTILPAP